MTSSWMRILGWSLTTSVLALGSCDRSHGPAIRNGLTARIELKVESNDGVTRDVSLEPGNELQRWDPRLEYSSIEVSAQGRLLYRLNAADLSRLDARTPRDDAVWNVERSGIRPVTRRQLPSDR